MSHLSVRTLLYDVAKNLADNQQFGYGRRSEFNMIENKSYPYIWLLPLTASRRFISTDNLTRTMTWNCALVFLDMDSADAKEDQSDKLLDEQYETAQKYMQALDDWSYRSSDTLGPVTIQNDLMAPFYKDDSGIHTGWLVTFQMVVSDNFEYCSPENVELYSGNL